MSRFYSEMITWSTVAMTGGAMLLGDINPEPTTPETATPVAIATAEDIPDALAPERAPDPYSGIRPAELEEVVFTATGESPDRVIADVRPSGRVTAEAVNLRAGPGTGFAIVGRASEGQRLPVTGARDGVWLEVELAGVDGPVWVHGRYFEAPGE